MQRREFITLVGGAAAWPLSAQAQPKTYRVGFLIGPSAERAASLFQSLKDGLRERGYVEGRNVEFVPRYADGKMERLPDLAAELARLNVDVIVTGSNQHVVAARQATSTIPIVFVYAVDPVGTGLVASLARPGGNVTGLTSDASPEFWNKFLSLLREVVPKTSRVGVLGQVSAKLGFAELDEAARKLNLSLQMADVQRKEDIDGALANISQSVEALVVVPGPLVYSWRKEIADAALKHRLPAIVSVQHFVQEGLLMSYGPNLDREWRRASAHVDKILKGAAPGDLPVEQPIVFELAINMKTAQALAVSIPTALLATATDVIE
ncbi:MAG: ABC transporter substrate-binding protein [Beijerinckiaceae bacterium]